MLKEIVLVAKILTPLAAVALGVLIFVVDPFQIGALGIALFFVSLAIFLLGMLIILGSLRHKKEGLSSVYLRRSALAVGLVLVLLFLQAIRGLFWWNALILILLVFGLEFYLTVKVDESN
jgi:hypothetical protein